MSTQNISYSNTCVSYMDIQGFKEMVLKLYLDKPAAVHGILKEFKRAQYLDPCDWTSWQPDIVSFSDSIVRGVTQREPDCSYGQTVAHELQALRLIQQSLLIWRPSFACEEEPVYYGIHLRGGLSAGGIYIDEADNLAFGPALIKAIELEGVKGSPFRIVIDAELIDLYPDTMKSLESESIIALDKDGLWFVDYLSVNSYADYGALIEIQRLKKVCDVLQSNLSLGTKDKPLHQKYLWAAKRHNTAVTTSKQLKKSLSEEGICLSWLTVQTEA